MEKCSATQRRASDVRDHVEGLEGVAVREVGTARRRSHAGSAEAQGRRGGRARGAGASGDRARAPAARRAGPVPEGGRAAASLTLRSELGVADGAGLGVPAAKRAGGRAAWRGGGEAWVAWAAWRGRRGVGGVAEAYAPSRRVVRRSPAVRLRRGRAFRPAVLAVEGVSEADDDSVPRGGTALGFARA